MGKKPVHILTGLFLVGTALSGCQSQDHQPGGYSQGQSAPGVMGSGTLNYNNGQNVAGNGRTVNGSAAVSTSGRTMYDAPPSGMQPMGGNVVSQSPSAMPATSTPGYTNGYAGNAAYQGNYSNGTAGTSVSAGLNGSMTPQGQVSGSNTAVTNGGYYAPTASGAYGTVQPVAAKGPVVAPPTSSSYTPPSSTAYPTSSGTPSTTYGTTSGPSGTGTTPLP